MFVYLVQHGLAASKEEDPARPLTPAGRDEVVRMARAVAAVGARPASILHSGKKRAAQTAEIFAEHAGPAHGIHAADGLDPGDAPQRAAERLRQAGEPLMLVGHLPHLARLVGLLVAGDPAREVVAFRNAGVVCLERGESGFAVRWILVPELLAR